MKKSFAVRLSLRFMFILTTSILLLSFGFLFFVRTLVKANQTNELKKAENIVFASVTSEQSQYSSSFDIPYYMTYIVYKVETENVIATNDPFLPLLKDSGEKALRYFEKDFFFDGDLDILYYAETHWIGETSIVCAVAFNIENDSFSMIFSRLPISLLLMALPVLLLSFLVSLYITKNTINPVVKITRAAQAMTTENLDGQLPLTGRGDEIDELSRTFNELFLRIKADFDRERQFSSDVSHELNTPLTVISGQANLLLRWGKDKPEQLEKSLNAIKNESKSMHAIIENLLQISRIESGRIKPQTTTVNIGEVFERVAEEFAAVAPKAKFNLHYGDKPFILETDPEMLHQILTVLVSNSIKFAGENCKIILRAGILDDKIFIAEADNGPGISQEALPHVFERFFRGDEAHTRKAGGSGLGLSIAKTLAGALDASISAGNVEPHGAFFELLFN
ncbi:MAG: HAMP domain-containing histidine kinase [Treponema sp.]|nr:HAMP domain-containing histidine kinase [Treponema sp.]